MAERHLTVEQVAADVQQSPYTVRRLLREGLLRGVKTGDGNSRHHWRVPESAVAEYWNSRPSNQPTEAP